MGRTVRTDAEYIAELERRVRRLERALGPWQLSVGRYGDLVADNLDTGVRTVVARRESEPQGKKET